MQFGVMMFISDLSVRPDVMARMTEERGFESLWFGEHTHIPVQLESVRPSGERELPRQYLRCVDPFISLTAAACATTTLKFGTSICLVVQRDPIILAKQIASFDLISNGRFMLGVGGGWNREEVANHGVDPRTRFRALNERMLAMKQIWMNDEAEFHGQFINFDKIWSWPKPVQKPHPPLIMGGNGPTTLDRVVMWADGWLPGRTIQDPEANPNLKDRLAELRHKAEDAGRDPDSIQVTISQAWPQRDNIERLAELGIVRCLFSFPDGSKEECEKLLDERAELIAKVR